MPSRSTLRARPGSAVRTRTACAPKCMCPRECGAGASEPLLQPREPPLAQRTEALRVEGLGARPGDFRARVARGADLRETRREQRAPESLAPVRRERARRPEPAEAAVVAIVRGERGDRAVLQPQMP